MWFTLFIWISYVIWQIHSFPFPTFFAQIFRRYSIVILLTIPSVRILFLHSSEHFTLPNTTLKTLSLSMSHPSDDVSTGNDDDDYEIIGVRQVKNLRTTMLTRRRSSHLEIKKKNGHLSNHVSNLEDKKNSSFERY